MRRMIIALTVILTLSIVSSSTMAKNNTISFTGTFSSTVVGLEYERRLGSFGLGAEASFIQNPAFLMPTATSNFIMRANALVRYYLDFVPIVKPYITLAPGAYMAFVPSSEAPAMYTFFDMHASLGAQFAIGSLRLAAEAGYEFFLVPAVAEVHPIGNFFAKGAVGWRF